MTRIDAIIQEAAHCADKPKEVIHYSVRGVVFENESNAALATQILYLMECDADWGVIVTLLKYRLENKGE